MKPRTKLHYGIFLASPGDVQPERELITRYLDEWNMLQGEDKGVSLDVIKWERNLITKSGVKAQEEIIKQLVKKCHILIGMFCSRFGSPTEKFASGTLEEIEYFLANKMPVIMYFINKPLQSTRMTTKELDGIRSINEFKDKYKDMGIYKEIDANDLDNLRISLFKDISANIDYVSELDIASSVGTIVISEEHTKSKEWFEISIKKAIEDYLLEHGLSLIYKRELTFDENCRIWRASTSLNSDYHKNTLSNARIHAFNTKYGRYDYTKDLREKYIDSWFMPILSMLHETGFDEAKQFNVIGVGSNNGTELEQIFKKYKKCELNVLDLSNEAVKSGQVLYGTKMTFEGGNMEGCAFDRSSYDVYLNLRSIHSTGVDIRLTLTECYRILRPGGIAIISISNGYLLPESGQNQKGQVETSGMYDNKTKFFSDKKPYSLVSKVRDKLENYGFKDIEVHTGNTEIFIKGIK